MPIEVGTRAKIEPRAPKMIISDQKPTILLVEDGEDAAELIRRTVDSEGELTWVRTAEAGLECLLEGEWNLVLVDVELPGDKSLDFLQEARSRYPALTAMVLSSRENFDDAVRAIRAGAADYISRPFDPVEFRTKVRIAITADRFNRSLRRPNETVLAIGAHPDDVEIGCGGVLLRHTDVGHEVHLLTLTGGEAGGDAVERAEESRLAAKLMSAHLHVLDLEDTGVAEGLTVAAISEVVDQIKPTTVYTHSARDVHQDHRVAHHASLAAVRGVPKVYAYQSPSTTVEFRPSNFISIDSVLERKLAAIEVFESQTKIRSYLAPDLLRANARYWSRFGTSQYAEPLEVLREADLLLQNDVAQGLATRRTDHAQSSHAGL